MAIEPQNVWPSLDRDVKAANGLVGRFLTAGFYYKTFIRPQTLWPAYEKVLATFAPAARSTSTRRTATTTSATPIPTSSSPAAARPAWRRRSPPPRRAPR